MSHATVTDLDAYRRRGGDARLVGEARIRFDALTDAATDGILSEGGWVTSTVRWDRHVRLELLIERFRTEGRAAPHVWCAGAGTCSVCAEGATCRRTYVFAGVGATGIHPSCTDAAVAVTEAVTSTGADATTTARAALWVADRCELGPDVAHRALLGALRALRARVAPLHVPAAGR